MKPNITTLESANCLRTLQAASEPLVAADLARKLHLAGCRETQRRHVRAIIKQLRDNGSQIVATLQGGYFITEDRQTWRDYLEGRQIDCKKVLGRTHRAKKMITNHQGQGLLFGQHIRCGVATMAVL